MMYGGVTSIMYVGSLSGKIPPKKFPDHKYLNSGEEKCSVNTPRVSVEKKV